MPDLLLLMNPSINIPKNHIKGIGLLKAIITIVNGRDKPLRVPEAPKKQAELIPRSACRLTCL